MNKNIILAGAIAIGLYLFSQGKAIFSAHSTQTMRQKVAERVPERRLVLPAIPMPKKVAQKRIGHPITRVAYLAALRKVAQKRIGHPITRAAYLAALREVAQKRIGHPITRAAYVAALREASAQKAAVRKAAVRKIGKKIAQKVAQKVAKKRVASWKAVQQKAIQKTTHSTPSVRRKKRLQALYGSHWHDIWVQRQK